MQTDANAADKRQRKRKRSPVTEDQEKPSNTKSYDSDDEALSDSNDKEYANSKKNKKIYHDDNSDEREDGEISNDEEDYSDGYESKRSQRPLSRNSVILIADTSNSSSDSDHYRNIQGETNMRIPCTYIYLFDGGLWTQNEINSFPFIFRRSQEVPAVDQNNCSGN